MNTGINGFYKGVVNFSIFFILSRATFFGVYDSLKVKTTN